MANEINIPKSFYADTSIAWNDNYNNYPADEYTVSYHVANKDNTYEIAGSANGVTFDFDPDTSSYAVGKYSFQITATQLIGGRKYVIATGYVSIKTNFAGTSGVDTRCIQERLLDQVNDWLEGNITNTKQKITHSNMEVWNYDREGLFEFRDKLMRELEMVKAAKARKNGKFMKSIKWVI